jgi:hypothetical protein
MIAMLIVAAVVALGAFLVFGERLLFRWYLWTIGRIAVTEAPGEAVISYPLA